MNYNELESDNDELPDQIDITPVSSQPHDWTISTLREKHDRGQIDLQPHYQREYVWNLKPELPSRLIESLLLQIPIPPLYFVRLRTGKLEVVDGQQRLTTLIRFVKNEFPLQKLQRLSALNGKLYRDLNSYDQEKIADATIRSIVIDAGANADLRYEVFERLNRGAMALNEQEIRNCAYRGPFCDLLADLEQDINWRKIRGTPEPEARFVEREMILRFFSFVSRIDHYTGNLKAFLNAYMGIRAPTKSEAIEELRALFKNTMQNIYSVFGESSARIYTVPDETAFTDGKWETKFSISAFDIQASALMGHSPSRLSTARTAIVDAYRFFLATNPQVNLAISTRPSSRDATKMRWIAFKPVVQEILSNAANTGTGEGHLSEARALFRTGYPIAAGAIAGIALERHLKRLCETQKPPLIPKGDAINAVNATLKAANIYDLIQSRRIELFADIRNRCSHAVHNPPSQTDIWELIEGTESLMAQFPLR